MSNKRIILFFLFICVVFIFQNNCLSKKIDAGLEKRVNKYWRIRAAHDLKNSFLMEAPYIRFLTPFKIYKIYLAKTIRPKQVKIKNKMCYTITNDGTDCRLYLEMINNDTNKKVYVHDEWIYLNKKWYHVIKDPLVFSNCFPP